jgi:hypothetical protein
MGIAMRAITLAVLISILAGATAAAQSTRPSAGGVPPPSQVRPSTNGMSNVPQAPIGHRQPTQGDLPPSLRRDEDSNGPPGRAPDPFADVPNICNGC